jgi:hypothetical protein
MGPNQQFDARLLLGWRWFGMFLCWWPREELILIVVSSLVWVIYTVEASGRDRGDGPALIRMEALKGLFLVHSPASLWRLLRLSHLGGCCPVGVHALLSLTHTRRHPPRLAERPRRETKPLSPRSSSSRAGSPAES